MGHTNVVKAVKFHPTSEDVWMTASADCTAKIWSKGIELSKKYKVEIVVVLEKETYYSF